jgi:hypothetical protein
VDELVLWSRKTLDWIGIGECLVLSEETRSAQRQKPRLRFEGDAYYLEFLTERPTLKPTDKEMTTMMKRQVSDPITHFRLLVSRVFNCVPARRGDGVSESLNILSKKYGNMT